MFNVYEQRLGRCSLLPAGEVSLSYVSPTALPFEPLPREVAACCWRRRDDLHCQGPLVGSRSETSAISRGFFARKAYHLFNNVHGKPLEPPHRHRGAASEKLACRTGFKDTCAYTEMATHLLNGSWVLSALIRRALGV